MTDQYDDDDDRYGEGYADAMRARLGGDITGEKPPITIEDVAHMTPEEINTHWDEVSSILERQ